MSGVNFNSIPSVHQFLSSSTSLTGFEDQDTAEIKESGAMRLWNKILSILPGVSNRLLSVTVHHQDGRDERAWIKVDVDDYAEIHKVMVDGLFEVGEVSHKGAASKRNQQPTKRSEASQQLIDVLKASDQWKEAYGDVATLEKVVDRAAQLETGQVGVFSLQKGKGKPRFFAHKLEDGSLEVARIGKLLGSGTFKDAFALIGHNFAKSRVFLQSKMTGKSAAKKESREDLEMEYTNYEILYSGQDSSNPPRGISPMPHKVVWVGGRGTVQSAQYGYMLAENFDFGDLEVLTGEAEKSTTKLSTKERCALLADGAAGVAYMHEKGMVHGDIKPGNMFAKAGKGGKPIGVVVADIGGARIAGETGPRWWMVGTPRYMSWDDMEADFNEESKTHKPTTPKKWDVLSYALMSLEILLSPTNLQDKRLLKYKEWEGRGDMYVGMDEKKVRAALGKAKVPEQLQDLLIRAAQPKMKDRTVTMAQLRDAFDS